MSFEFKVGDKVRIIGKTDEGDLEIGDESTIEYIYPYHHLPSEKTGGKVMYALVDDSEWCYYVQDLELISTQPEVTPEPAPTQPTFKPGARVRYNHSFSCTPTYPDLVGRAGYIVSASDETKMAEVSFEGRVERIAWVNLELIEEVVEEEAEVENRVRNRMKDEVELKVGHLVLSPEGFYGTMREVDFEEDRFMVEWEDGEKYDQTYGYVFACRERYLNSIATEPSVEPKVEAASAEVEPEVEAMSAEIGPEVELKVNDRIYLAEDFECGTVKKVGQSTVLIEWDGPAGEIEHSYELALRCRHDYLDRIEAEPQVRSEQTDGAIPPDFFEDLGPIPTLAFDEVNKASHYNQGQFEVIRVLEDWLSPEEYRGFCRGNVLKYTARYNEKGGEKDLKKARYYLDELIRVESCIV